MFNRTFAEMTKATTYRLSVAFPEINANEGDIYVSGFLDTYESLVAKLNEIKGIKAKLNVASTVHENTGFVTFYNTAYIDLETPYGKGKLTLSDHYKQFNVKQIGHVYGKTPLYVGSRMFGNNYSLSVLTSGTFFKQLIQAAKELSLGKLTMGDFLDGVFIKNTPTYKKQLISFTEFMVSSMYEGTVSKVPNSDFVLIKLKGFSGNALDKLSTQYQRALNRLLGTSFMVNDTKLYFGYEILVPISELEVFAGVLNRLHHSETTMLSVASFELQGRANNIDEILQEIAKTNDEMAVLGMPVNPYPSSPFGYQAPRPSFQPAFQPGVNPMENGQSQPQPQPFPPVFKEANLSRMEELNKKFIELRNELIENQKQLSEFISSELLKDFFSNRKASLNNLKHSYALDFNPTAILKKRLLGVMLPFVDKDETEEILDIAVYGFTDDYNCVRMENAIKMFEKDKVVIGSDDVIKYRVVIDNAPYRKALLTGSEFKRLMYGDIEDSIGVLSKAEWITCNHI